MRGLYSTTVLHALSSRFAEREGRGTLDIGKGFDLVIGTSTGAILAAAIAAGIPLDCIARLYEEAGPQIFREPIPPYDKSLRFSQKIRFVYWAIRHLCQPVNSNATLESSLREIFGDMTFGKLYRERGIGLCIAATEFLNYHPRVFKTPHVEIKDRDNELTLADACLASTAAPIYLPLASITEDGHAGRVYADGGLWANHPVLLGVIQGLALSTTPGQPIVVMSVGTCSPAAGSQLPAELNRARLWAWLDGLACFGVGDERSGDQAARLRCEAIDRASKEARQTVPRRCVPKSRNRRRIRPL